MTNREKLQEMASKDFARVIINVTFEIHAQSFDPFSEEDALDRVFSAKYDMEEWLENEYEKEFFEGINSKMLEYDIDDFCANFEDEEYDEDEYLDDLEEENI